MNKSIILLSLVMLAACTDDEWPVNEEHAVEWVDAEFTDTLGCRYGVRWQTDNPFDTGERCFDAVGKRSLFGVGGMVSHSDFDRVYPWNSIRRCNVRRHDGHTIITYDDDPAFRTDGSQGDVFVRIPKFYVEKYVDGGYEYRVVSGKGERPHPAFIENGHELDAVYVSAFEGHIGPDSLLRSLAGVIPTTNITAQQFLEAAQRRGPQYTLYDMRTVDLLFSLIAVEYGCRNTSAVFGHGIADYRQPLEEEWDSDRCYLSIYNHHNTNTITCGLQNRPLISVGSCVCICDSDQHNVLTYARCTDIKVTSRHTTYTFNGPPIDINTHCFIGNCAQSTNWIETCSAPHHSPTGRANIMEKHLNPRERNPMRYRWIENIVGNVWHFLPDVTFFNQQMYVCSNMDKYRFGSYDEYYEAYGETFSENTDNSVLRDEPYLNYWVTTLMPDDDGKGVSMGNSYDRSLLSTHAFGAYYYVKDGLNIVANGGGFDHRFRCNLLTSRAWISPQRRWFLYGARLLFKDI